VSLSDRARPSAARFLRPFAIASLAISYAIVVTGATVRLTGSGLGCEHWPGCEPGRFLPAADHHAFIEFGNRTLGGITVLTTLGLALCAWFAPGLSRRARWLAIGVFAATFTQAPLGALTVYVHLKPAMVIVHFLVSVVALGFATWLVVLLANQIEPATRQLQWGSRLLVASCFVLLVSGTFVTAAGPHSGGGNKAAVSRLGTLDEALYFHVPATALFGTMLLVGLVYLARRRREHPRSFALSVGVTALALIQLGIGEIQYRTHLPWELVLAHVAVAVAVWIGAVALAAQLSGPTEQTARTLPR
jgi:heme a synthase